MKINIILHISSLSILSILPRLSTGIDRTRKECERTANERDAFKRLAKRVATIDPDSQVITTDSSRETSVSSSISTKTIENPVQSQSIASAKKSQLQEFRDTYRETIMNLSHYEEEYDESFNENLAEELGPSLAQAVVESNIFTEQIKTTAIQRSFQAYEKRKKLLHRLEEENEALVDRRRQLREMHEDTMIIKENLYPRPVRELIHSWDRLETVEAECETLLSERQSQIHTRPGPISSWTLQSYLYEPYQWTYPVLNDGVDVLTRIQDAKQDTLRAIYNW
jgi:hypothetical protein